MSLHFDSGRRPGRVSLGEMFDRLYGPDAPLRLTAYDGSVAGPADAPVGLRLVRPRGTAYLASSPGSLGLVRAYVQGDIELDGTHPGDPYEAVRAFRALAARRPPPLEALRWLRSLGPSNLIRPPLPPQEVRPVRPGRKHGRRRDATVISHHYDVSNRFYEMVLGPSMTYTCACYSTSTATLEEAQEHKYDLVARKLGLKPGMRLLDVGCGWGGMVRHAAREHGARVLGVTLSAEQAQWASDRIVADGLENLAEVRHLDYRDVTETDFDAISAIGLIEHIGIENYASYFEFLRSRLRPGGRLLNHGITRSDNLHPGIPKRGFIGRYVFPDGGITGSGAMVTAMEDAGLEVQHQENLRVHYARTLQGWCDNLVANWDECVAETSLPTAKVWGLYMAGSRFSFERNDIQLHQVLATRTAPDGNADYPLRHDFGT